MQKTITALLVIIGIIHILPITGLLGAEKLSKLYGFQTEDNTLILLMRHRAVLFGILGVFFVFAAFRQAYQPLAFVMAGVSILSFLILEKLESPVHEAIGKVVIADWIALACLFVAICLWFLSKRTG